MPFERNRTGPRALDRARGREFLLRRAPSRSRCDAVPRERVMRPDAGATVARLRSSSGTSRGGASAVAGHRCSDGIPDEPTGGPVARL
jgi:hypothetical protein